MPASKKSRVSAKNLQLMEMKSTGQANARRDSGEKTHRIGLNDIGIRTFAPFIWIFLAFQLYMLTYGRSGLAMIWWFGIPYLIYLVAVPAIIYVILIILWNSGKHFTGLSKHRASPTTFIGYTLMILICVASLWTVYDSCKFVQMICSGGC